MNKAKLFTSAKHELEGSHRVELGGRVITHRGMARNGNKAYGIIVVNTDEGMLSKKLSIPTNIENPEEYILNEIVHNPNGNTFEFGHKMGDNQLVVGQDCKIYVLAPGVVFVEVPNDVETLKFKIKPLNHKKLDIPRSTYIHFNADEEIKMANLQASKKGYQGR